MDSSENTTLLAALAENTVYFMGGSFIAGSLFTVFCLLVLDFMRRNKNTDTDS